MFSHIMSVRGAFRPTSTRKTRHLIEILEQRTLFAAAGELDPGFSGDGIVTYTPPGSQSYLEFATAMDIRNGRIVVAGSTDSPTTGMGRVALAAFDLSGKPDTTFSADGFQMHDFGRPFGTGDVAILPDSRLLVLGVGFLAKLNAGGGRSTSFGGGDGEVALPFDRGSSMAVAPDGKIVVAGRNADDSIGIARFNADGSPDTTFGGGDGVAFFADVGVYLFTGPDVAVQSDGKILFTATDPGEMPDSPVDDFDSAVFRLEMDGDLDPTFAGGTGRMELDFGDDEALNAIALDKQGRIILGGQDQTYRYSFVARLLASGQIDPGFTQTRIDNSFDVVDLVVAPDSKIVVATWSDRGLVARLNINGGFDTSFGAGDGYLSGNGGDVSMFAMDVQPDGKIVTAAGGNFVTVARRFASANSQPSVEGSLQLTNGVVRYTGTPGKDEVLVDTNSFNGKHTLRTRFTTQEFPASVSSFDLRGNAGDDTLTILGHIFLNDRLEGGLGNDKLRGGGGNDLLKGQEGNDELFGGDGSDTLDGGQGTDYQDGGDGADTIDYSLRNSAVYVDLEGDADDGPAGENDTVLTIEHILGGRGNDILIGDALPNFIRGNGGDDTIAGRSNNDTLKGDAGRDKLYGDAGNDFLDALDGIIDFIIDGGQDTDTAKKDPNDPLTSIELLA